MKILKVGIKKERTVGHTHFEYPEEWDAEKISVLAYEDHPENLGNVMENCLCVTDDAVAGKLLKHPEVREITTDEANAFGRQWRPSKVRVTDEDKVIDILRKLLSKAAARVALRKYLTEQEIDNLDEEKAESGIRREKEFDIREFV